MVLNILMTIEKEQGFSKKEREKPRIRSNAENTSFGLVMKPLMV